MTPKYLFKLILLIIIGLGIISCEKEKYSQNPTQQTGYKYPLKNGNSWNYHRTVFIEYFNASDSTTIIDRDTFDSDYLIQNENIENLTDSIVAFKLLSTNLTSGVISIEYCNNNSQGLFCYAYKINDGAEPFPNKVRNMHLKSNLMIPIMTNILSINDIKTDSLTYENPPALIISYPIIYNTKWTLRTSDQMTVYKEIIGNENITINQVNHNCYKIRYSYSDNIIENIDFVDYVSVVGLVKRRILIKNIIMTNEFGDTTDTTVNFLEETKLTNYLLN